jgi:hypothetical protein
MSVEGGSSRAQYDAANRDPPRTPRHSRGERPPNRMGVTAPTTMCVAGAAQGSRWNETLPQTPKPAGDRAAPWCPGGEIVSSDADPTGRPQKRGEYVPRHSSGHRDLRPRRTGSKTPWKMSGPTPGGCRPRRLLPRRTPHKCASWGDSSEAPGGIAARSLPSARLSARRYVDSYAPP